MGKKFDKDGIVERQMDVIEPVLKDKNNNWYKLAKSLYTDIDPELGESYLKTFLSMQQS